MVLTSLQTDMLVVAVVGLIGALTTLAVAFAKHLTDPNAHPPQAPK